jgi:hypothetical protein
MPRPRRLPTVLTPAEAAALLRAATLRYRTGRIAGKMLSKCMLRRNPSDLNMIWPDRA